MKKILSFKGGVHPPPQKNTATYNVKDIYPQKGSVLAYPLAQQIGPPCVAKVAPGDYVMVGQKLGDYDKPMTVPVHASVSGEVKEIRSCLTPSGSAFTSVFIENDGLHNEHPEINQPVNYQKLSRDEKLSVIREAGIIGMGGAGFPAHIKLNPPRDKHIDYIIINAAECEPYLTTDHRILIEETENIVLGLQVLLSLFERAQGIIAVEANKMDAVDKLRRCIYITPKASGRIKVVVLKPKYPQGSEKQIISACTGRMVPSGGLPYDAGCIVNNTDTAVAVHRAFYRGRPLMRKIVTVAGDAVKNPGNYKVRIGMMFSDLIESIGGYTEEPYKLVSGGPMMGAAMYKTDIPVTKTSSAFLAFTEKEGRLPAERNCIRCGRCVTTCPVGLMPLMLNQQSLHNREDQFIDYCGMDCIECGSCTYICPSKRYLMQSIRAMRSNIIQNAVKRTESDILTTNADEHEESVPDRPWKVKE
ncbi:MAG: electron transport complex subunit RsxC [Defluviitaleaceae bacterium]|nr:electron transport complex subunit RsxC [Defluviitaleaceae bacterium]